MSLGTNILEFINDVFNTLGINVSPLVKQVIASIGVFLLFIIIW